MNACAWGQLAGPIQVAAGQDVTGVQVTVPTGATLQVRVNDAANVLGAANLTAAALPDARFQLIVRPASRQVHRVPLISQDAQGRTYAITIPFGTALSLSATSAQASVMDQAGKPVQAEIPVQVPQGSQAAPMVFAVGAGKP